MKKLFLSLMFCSLFSIPVLACLNGETKKLKDGTEIYTDFKGFVPRGHSFNNPEGLEKTLGGLEKEYERTKDLDYLSDKGYILIILKKYKEAIELYKRIESIAPGRYSTASNMGTAYELIGNNVEALKWIEKSIKINPGSHSSSEWIHANILKAKIKGSENYTSESLIHTDFGNRKHPETDLTKEELYRLRKSLFYQLNERISFVEPKDKIIAQLFFDLGNVAFLMKFKDEAYMDYEKAKDYGFKDPIVQQRMISLSSMTNSKEARYSPVDESTEEMIKIGLSVFSLLFSAIIVFVFRKKIFLMLK
ncbi:Tetratricopeptide repeat-containing protein [Chryseobacterium oleae]|uniref:Tetratricopeptide repeat-containing protein n=1 Tax=Chryseobacterium oleae TaxID=491207 RepID=A0A1I4VL34_CHROL|nr:tetratricopeptide repeat protein [Chryseobacterium oleae]SFN01765.1 Tetratricopeptide repeat-containing protein [Chryseobacterium oleae]